MEAFKNTCTTIWYTLGTIGIIDMFIQSFTNRNLKIIHSVLDFFFK